MTFCVTYFARLANYSIIKVLGGSNEVCQTIETPCVPAVR